MELYNARCYKEKPGCWVFHSEDSENERFTELCKECCFAPYKRLVVLQYCKHSRYAQSKDCIANECVMHEHRWACLAPGTEFAKIFGGSNLHCLRFNDVTMLIQGGHIMEFVYFGDYCTNASPGYTHGASVAGQQCLAIGVVKFKPASANHNMTCYWSVNKHFSVAPESSGSETELECFIALLWLNGKLSCGKSN